MKNFFPKQPNPYIKGKEENMAPARYGELNAIVEVINQPINNVYADNAAALAAGLKVGTLYSTSAGAVRIVV